MPLISVIIPVYNVENYLRQCLDSIINQTLNDIEIICVDDGSTDKSLDILKEYKQKDNRITILTQQNLHAGVARNTGYKTATGKYLSFLDSDDFFELNMLEDMYNQAEKDGSDVVVCGYRGYSNKTHQYIKNYPIDSKLTAMSPVEPQQLGEKLFEVSGLNAWSKLFKKELFDEYNLHFEECVSCNDLTCVCTALALANKISFMDKFYISYRMNQHNNLTAHRHTHTESFLFAIQQLENNLKHFDIYDKFKEPFVYKVKISFKWEMALCTELQKRQRKAYAKKHLSEELFGLLYKGIRPITNKKSKLF